MGEHPPPLSGARPRPCYPPPLLAKRPGKKKHAGHVARAVQLWQPTRTGTDGDRFSDLRAALCSTKSRTLLKNFLNDYFRLKRFECLPGFFEFVDS